MKNSETAIILPTYNQYEITKKNILLLKKQTVIPDIIIVDNLSNDETSKKLKKEFKDVKIISSKDNTGSSGGQNQGAKYALKNKYKNIIFSDNDAYPISKNLIEKLVKKINSDNKIGFVVPKNIFIESINNSDEEEINGYAFHFLTTRREIIEEVGFPDINYFLQIDDLDYTNRIINKGYTGIKLNTVHFSHPFKAISNINPLFVYYTIRNTLYFVFKQTKSIRKVREIFNLLLKASIIVSFSELTDNLNLKEAVLLAIRDFENKKMGRNDKILLLKLKNFSEIKKSEESLKKPSEIYLSLWKNNYTLVQGDEKSYKFEANKNLRKVKYIMNLVKFQIKYLYLYFGR